MNYIQYGRDTTPVIIPLWAVEEIFELAKSAEMRMPSRSPQRRMQIAAAFQAIRAAVAKTQP